MFEGVKKYYKEIKEDNSLTLNPLNPKRTLGPINTFAKTAANLQELAERTSITQKIVMALALAAFAMLIINTLGPLFAAAQVFMGPAIASAVGPVAGFLGYGGVSAGVAAGIGTGVAIAGLAYGTSVGVNLATKVTRDVVSGVQKSVNDRTAAFSKDRAAAKEEAQGKKEAKAQLKSENQFLDKAESMIKGGKASPDRINGMLKEVNLEPKQMAKLSPKKLANLSVQVSKMQALMASQGIALESPAMLKVMKMQADIRSAATGPHRTQAEVQAFANDVKSQMVDSHSRSGVNKMDSELARAGSTRGDKATFNEALNAMRDDIFATLEQANTKLRPDQQVRLFINEGGKHDFELAVQTDLERGVLKTDTPSVKQAAAQDKARSDISTKVKTEQDKVDMHQDLAGFQPKGLADLLVKVAKMEALAEPGSQEQQDLTARRETITAQAGTLQGDDKKAFEAQVESQMTKKTGVFFGGANQMASDIAKMTGNETDFDQALENMHANVNKALDRSGCGIQEFGDNKGQEYATACKAAGVKQDRVPAEVEYEHDGEETEYEYEHDGEETEYEYDGEETEFEYDIDIDSVDMSGVYSQGNAHGRFQPPSERNMSSQMGATQQGRQ